MSDKSLETLKVVIEGDVQPLKKELKDLQKELDSMNRNVDVGKELRNSMKKSMETMRQFREQSKKINDSIMNAFKFPEGGKDASNKKLDAIRKVWNEMKKNQDAWKGSIQSVGIKNNTKDIDLTEAKLKKLIATRNELEANGGEDTSKYQKINEAISHTRMELAQLSAQQKEYEQLAGSTGNASSFFKKIQSGEKNLSGAIVKASGAFAALIQKFKTGIPLFSNLQKSMSGMNATGKGLVDIFRTIDMSAKSMFASLVNISNNNRVIDGIKNMAKYSNVYGAQFNKSMNQMYDSLKKLQNALVTAFEPVVSTVAPYITKFVLCLADGINELSQFSSALTNSNTWTMVADFSKMIKDSWANADFTGIGNTVGSKLKIELDSIKWDGIKASCNQIANSIGTFINGFIETDGLNQSIGKSLGESINTGVGMANTFFSTAKFWGLGNSLVNTANGALQTANYAILGQSVANGLSTGINTWGSYATTFNLDELGTKIGDAIKTAFDYIPWDEVKQKFKDACTSNLSNLDINIGGVNVDPGKPDIKDEVIDVFKDAVKSILSEKLAKAFGKVVGGGAAEGGAAAAGEVAAGGAAAAAGGSIASIAVPVTVSAVAGWNIGKNLGKIIFPDDAKYYDDFKLFGKNGFFDDVKYFFTDILGSGGTDTINKADKTGSKKNVGDFYGVGGNDGNILSGAKDKISTWFNEWVNLNGFNELGKKPSFNADVTTDSKKDAGNLHAGIQAALDKLGPFNKATTTPTKASSLFNPLQTDFSKNLFSANTITPTKAFSLFDPLQTDFSKNLFSANTITPTKAFSLFDPLQTDFFGNKFSANTITPTKASSLFDPLQTDFFGNKFSAKTITPTTAFSLFNPLQTDFAKFSLSTMATTSNDGNSLRTVLQDAFGSNSLYVNAATTNNGDGIRNWLQNGPNGFGFKNLSTGVSIPDGAKAFEDFKGEWSAKNPTLFAFLNLGIGKIASGFSGFVQSIQDFVANICPKATGGVFSGGTWRPVTAYAGGGMPASAQLFMAREAGPELVGTIGGHSAVVNNDQIVSSVASGVYRAVASAMMVTNANNSQSSSQPIYVYVGGKQITDYVVKDVNNRTLATGQCPIKV